MALAKFSNDELDARGTVAVGASAIEPPESNGMAL
jgi:hypothetical protein